MTDVYAGWRERYEAEGKAMRAGWLAVLGSQPIMPRDVVLSFPSQKEVGKGKIARYQKTVRTTREYAELLEERAPRSDLWVGWSPSNQYGLQGMDRVFGDIDDADLERALVRARRYEEWCMADFGVQPVAIFTGGKGIHLHMTHDFVDVPGLGDVLGAGTAYSDAFASLIQGSGAHPDLGPLKTRKSYPRVPYSMNVKATGIRRQPVYTVPIDLTWSLKEVLQASAEIRVMPFRVPHSDTLGDLLAPAVEKAHLMLERRRKTAAGATNGLFDDLIHAALAFSEDVGWRLVDARDRPDGRRRVLSALYIPALMHRFEGDKDAVMDAAEKFVELSGAHWMEYKRFVEGAIKDCVLRDGTMRYPMGLTRFWMENNELTVKPNGVRGAP